MSRVFWWYSSENLSPRVRPDFLGLQQELLMPGQFAREHQNQWIEGADAFTSGASVAAAMGTGWVERFSTCPEPGHVMAVDIGAVSDPTVIGAGHLAGGVIYICRLITLQGSHEQPVRMAAVKESIRGVKASRPTGKIRIESWQGLSLAQELADDRDVPVELFAPTAKAHAEEWPLLADWLAKRTLVLPEHPRLREELLALSYEVGPTGVKVTDRTAVHQDHAVVIRMIVAALGVYAAPPLWIFFAGGPGPTRAAAPFAGAAPSMSKMLHEAAVDAELRRQKAQDRVEAAAKQGRAPAREDLNARAEAERAADIATQRRLEDADVRRMMRSDGPWWHT